MIAETVRARGAVIIGEIGKALSARPWLWRTALYVFALLAATFVFVIVRFPSDKLTAIINQAPLDAPFSLVVGKAGLTFPLGVKLSNVIIAQEGRPDLKIVTIPSLKIKPSILAAMIGVKRASLRASVLDGSVKAEVNAGTGGMGKWLYSGQFDEIDPAGLDLWGRFPWFSAKGKIDGEGNLEMEGNDPLTAEGSLKLTVADGKLIPGKSLNPSGEAIVISNGELELKAGKGMVTIAKGAFTGPQVTGLISGSITIMPELGDSRMSLALTLTITDSAKSLLGPMGLLLPQATAGKHIIRIGGTLSSPAIL